MADVEECTASSRYPRQRAPNELDLSSSAQSPVSPNAYWDSGASCPRVCLQNLVILTGTTEHLQVYYSNLGTAL
jgi:hypothetical protein